MKTTTDAYAKVTNQVIDLMEKGIIPWKKTWNAALDAPQNFVTGRPYNGFNNFILTVLAMVHHHTTNFWLTYNQAKNLGGNIKKGEHGTTIIYWIIKKDEEAPKDPKDENKKVMFPKAHTVFNLDQTEGIEYQVNERAATTENEKNVICQQIVDEMPKRPEIVCKGCQPCYAPIQDTVYIPVVENFDSTNEYYATLFHELAHSTGHASRLNRKEVSQGTHFGTGDYSREELVAEFTSLFLCEKANILSHTIENSTAYLQNWLTALKNDKKMLLIASSQAQKAANFILNIKNDDPE